MREVSNVVAEELDAHRSILSELELIKSLIDDIDNKLDLTIIKPIPSQMIKELTEIKDVLKSYSQNQSSEITWGERGLYHYVQRLGSIIDYLYKYNKVLNKFYSGQMIR